MRRALHQPIADAPFEPYAGPPGRLDVADIVTQENSSSIAAGLCAAEGGAFAYRCDYEALCIALDDNLAWETGDGLHDLAAGDIVWIPNGGTASYVTRGPTRFAYATYPVNWPEIVGWTAGRDIKDLSGTDDTGSLADVRLYRRADAAYHQFFSSSGRIDVAQPAGPQDGLAMAAGFAVFDGAAMDYTVGYDVVVVPLDGAFWLETEGRRLAGEPGDLFWIPKDVPAIYGSDGAATIVYVCWPANWADTIGWDPTTDRDA